MKNNMKPQTANLQSKWPENSIGGTFIAIAFIALAAIVLKDASVIAAPKRPTPKSQDQKKVSSATVSNTPQAMGQAYLASSVWRASECTKQQSFQSFFYARPAKVEVGNGKLGDGERLELLSVLRSGNIIEVRTRVCAPIGCNQTFEQYKILNQNQMQEWRFEGLLPNEAPNVVVKDGVANDGSEGRIFNRCSA